MYIELFYILFFLIKRIRQIFHFKSTIKVPFGPMVQFRYTIFYFFILLEYFCCWAFLPCTIHETSKGYDHKKRRTFSIMVEFHYIHTGPYLIKNIRPYRLSLNLNKKSIRLLLRQDFIPLSYNLNTN